MTVIDTKSQQFRVKMTDNVNEMCLREGYDLAGRIFRLDLTGEDNYGRFRGYILVDGKWRGPYSFERNDLEVA